MSKRRSREDERFSAADIIGFIETFCVVPEGIHVGKPLRLAPFQRQLIVDIYDNPAGTRRAIISMPRKSAKTALAACLVLAHLCGPPAKRRPNSQLYSAAQSRDQAGLIFTLCTKMIRMSPDLSRAVQIQETLKQLTCPELGTKYRALSAEVGTNFGLSPSLVVHDELGQCRGPRSALYEALETASAAQPDPLSVIISTQAPNDQDLLSILIDDALGGHDPHTVCTLYTAPVDLDPFAEATVRLANPAFEHFMNKREVMAMAADARRMPARENEFRNLILNQRIEVSSLFLSPAVWGSCGDRPAGLEGLEVYGGLDLSAVQDLTALVLIGWKGGKWNVHPTFWLPAEGLLEKAAQDHAPYDEWHRRGELELCPGKAVAYEFVAQHLRQVFNRYNVAKLAFDSWNFRHLRPWLHRAGFSDQTIEARFVEFGQGTKSMAPAMRDLEQVLLNGQLAHGGHPILAMNVAGCVVRTDEGGNRAPSKKRSKARIDGLVALLMAIGVAPLQAKAIDVSCLIA